MKNLFHFWSFFVFFCMSVVEVAALDRSTKTAMTEVNRVAPATPKPILDQGKQARLPASKTEAEEKQQAAAPVRRQVRVVLPSPYAK